EAEERVRREIEERTRRETEERARHEGEARARREAEEKVKRDAEERVRRETEERARREIEERARREEEERPRREEELRRRAEEEARERRAKRRPGGPAKQFAVMLLLTLIVAVAALPFVPLESSSYEKAAQAWLGEPVKIGTVNLTLLPIPQLKFEKVVIGKEHAMRV